MHAHTHAIYIYKSVFLQLSTVDLLLQHGADKEAKDIQGRTAVELAMSLGHSTIATLLQAGQISALQMQNLQ